MCFASSVASHAWKGHHFATVIIIIVVVPPVVSHDLIRGEVLAAALAWATHATRDPGIVLHIADVFAVNWLAPAVGLRLAAIATWPEALLAEPLVPDSASVTFRLAASLEPFAPDHVEILGVFIPLQHRLLILEQVLVHLDLGHQ